VGSSDACNLAPACLAKEQEYFVTPHTEKSRLDVCRSGSPSVVSRLSFHPGAKRFPHSADCALTRSVRSIRTRTIRCEWNDFSMFVTFASYSRDWQVELTPRKPIFTTFLRRTSAIEPRLDDSLDVPEYDANPLDGSDRWSMRVNPDITPLATLRLLQH
jgi:hypothetical protein